jgi:fructokinase
VTVPFVVAGEALVDVVVPTSGEPTLAVGGSPLNVAVGLARLDVPTLLITRIGDDEDGRFVADHVTGSGATLSAASVVPGSRTSRATARLGPDGSAHYEFELAWDLSPRTLPETIGLHVGSIGAALQPGRAAVLDLARQAADRGLFVSYDPNVRMSLLGDPAAVWREVREVAALSRLVKLSDEDASELCPGRPLEDVAHDLLAGDLTELVLVTLGARGALAVHGASRVHVPPPAASNVVDTVGAGDSFMAATIAALLEAGHLQGGAGTLAARTDEDLAALLGSATAAAAVTCSRRGANPPTRRELSPGWPVLRP